MHFQLLHKPRCFRSGIRTMRVNSREPREPQYLQRCSKSHFRGWPSAFRPFTCLAGFFAGHHSQRTPRRHRRAGPEQNLRIIDHVRIEYNKECALKWQVPKGKIFVFPKFQGNRSIISGDMTRGVYCVECEFGLRPFILWWLSTHTHE